MIWRKDLLVFENKSGWVVAMGLEIHEAEIRFGGSAGPSPRSWLSCHHVPFLSNRNLLVEEAQRDEDFREAPEVSGEHGAGSGKLRDLGTHARP